ncbi:hypothetical protein pipiens_016022 [Culex pipiens pipiens]|uniref:Charged multivesicular body protein 1b n=2 Tax=Culex pipiens TaxID=7175 RepID=A0ABD1CMZ6_CULPP
MFNLKFAVKDLERQAKKSEKEEKAEILKTKKAIQKGNTEVARIHAENAIRQKNQSLNYLRMSARVDAVASRVQTALTTRQVTNSMAGVVKAMDAAMKGMNLEKISGLMDKFESQFEDLDVQSSYMENTMSQTTTTAVPQNDVESLMQRVADEAGLELNMELPSGPASSAIGASTQASTEQDELTARLARLRQADPIYWLAENGLHVNSHRLFAGSTSPEGFPTRQERPRSGILDRHAPATIGGTEPLRGRPSGQATASTTPLWHAIPQRRCETIARTHTRRNKPKIDSVHTGLAPLIPQSDWRSDKNWRTTWKKHTKRGTQRAPFLCTAGKSARKLSGRSALLRAGECAASRPSPGRTEGALIKCGRNHLSPARRTWTGAGRSV